MNNLQLAILLDKYSDLLWNAVEEIESDLPDEYSEKTTNILGEESIYYPILQPILTILNNIDDDVEQLKKNEED